MIKNIIFDFDGVIIDSMPIKEIGFRKIFENFPKDYIDNLIKYHQENGGMSRFEKIRYFYEKILNRNISDELVADYAISFGKIMKDSLCYKKYLIKQTLYFIKENYKKVNFHIASGAEENELVFLCKKLGIYKYFKSIAGSPKKKSEIVNEILIYYKYTKEESILIGDSVNDYEAANQNRILFYGFNNNSLKSVTQNYIESFLNFKL